MFRRFCLRLLCVLVLTGVSLALLSTGTATSARADGGTGGKGATGTGGAGGTGFTGNAGTLGNGTSGAGGGGGGGGAGGGAGGDVAGFAGTGGAGGTWGSPNGAPGNIGGGGGGGFNGNGAGTSTLTNVAPLSGGNGGSNAVSGGSTVGGGGGGAGGFGAVVTGSGASSNSSTITGGNGGNGGFVPGLGGGGQGGSGGDGGVGVQFTTAGATFSNTGSVTGGNGGTGGTGNGGNGTPGVGGVGIIGSGITIFNSGTIAGGLANAGGGARADAILFTGGTNMYQGSAASILTGAVTINTGATLYVIDNVNTSTVNINGTIAAGPIGGIGKATIAGTLLMNPGSAFLVNTAGASAGHLQVAGPATLTGTLIVNGTGTPGTTFTILTATGGRNGTFASVIDNVPFTTASVFYDPNNVYLVLVPSANGLMAIPQTFNQTSVATALSAVSANPAFASVFTTFAGLSPDQIRYTLDQLSGEVYASALSAGIENQALWMRTIAQHVRLADSCLCPETAAGGASGCDGNGTWRTWATPFGMAGHNQGDGNAHAFAYDSVGFAAGGDRRIGDAGLIGFAAGYSNWENNTNLINSRTNSNSFNLAGYGRAQLGQAWLLGIASYEFDDYSSQRPMTFLGTTASGNFTGNQIGTYLETGYALNLGGLQLQPLGSLQYISAWRNSVNETGAGALDLNVSGAHADSLRGQLGARMLYPIATGTGGCILPEAGAYWIHECAQNSREDVNQFAGGGPTFLTNGANLGRDFGLFTTGFSMQMGPNLRAGLYYNGYVTPTAVAHGGMGQLQLTW